MKDNGFDLRIRMVSYAKRHGNKATAREFMTTVTIVRKWRKRYEESGSLTVSSPEVVHLNIAPTKRPRRLKNGFWLCAGN